MDKIEIEWQNISAIRAVIGQNSPGILEIEVLLFVLQNIVTISMC